MERQEGAGSMDRYFVKDTDKVKVKFHHERMYFYQPVHNFSFVFLGSPRSLGKHC
jgi:hypothetical protein